MFCADLYSLLSEAAVVEFLQSIDTHSYDK